jgi:hypothetical protein
MMSEDMSEQTAVLYVISEGKLKYKYCDYVEVKHRYKLSIKVSKIAIIRSATRGKTKQTIKWKHKREK